MTGRRPVRGFSASSRGCLHEGWLWSSCHGWTWALFCGAPPVERGCCTLHFSEGERAVTNDNTNSIYIGRFPHPVYRSKVNRKATNSNPHCHWSSPTHLWKNRVCSFCPPPFVKDDTIFTFYSYFSGEVIATAYVNSTSVRILDGHCSTGWYPIVQWDR